MEPFKRWNNLTGWAVFAVAALAYLLTMEPSSSLWDCAEFIATSYKLEVGHPPGAPLFMLMARLASLLAPSPHYVPHLVNAMSCLASAFCILFLFWTITHLGRRVVGVATRANRVTVLAAGAIGALAYAFTDTFWFSAVESEVYALSSMFTALVVWLMLKWEEQGSVRWIILIAYLMGLSIGVHILNLLTIPALVFIWYFKHTSKVTWKGILLSTLTAGAILLFINNLIIPYTVRIGAAVDLLFVNSFGLPVNSGMIFFVLAVFAALGFAIWYTHKHQKPVWNTIALCVTMVLIGFSSYATVTIRAAANPPMNSNNPNNPFALHALLSRDQYGDKPLLYGPQFSAPVTAYKYKNQHYLGEDGKYKTARVIAGYEQPAEFRHLFPRMWNHAISEEAYASWAAYRTRSEVVRDKRGEPVLDERGVQRVVEVPDFGERRVWDDHSGYEPLVIVEPTARENLNYFFSYQLGHMYWRYFMWNFVGRQNDIQPMASTLTDGNWLSGIRPLDELYLGPQSALPDEMAANRARNTYFFLPFILGLIGLIWHLNRSPRNFTVVMWLFLMMGVMLVIYFNTSPDEPRERDYVYAGSFYAFSIWIGLGVMAVREWFGKLSPKIAPVAAAVVCASVPVVLLAENLPSHDRSHRTMARDIGWNYLQSTLPNAIIINYGDNDTFPLWFNQEVDGVRTDVRIMNSSYLGGEWYVDQMKTRANDAAGVPFSLPRAKYTFVNDMVPIRDVLGKEVDLKEAIAFLASDDARTKTEREDGKKVDFLPASRFFIPVDKEAAIASGIVSERDRDLMVDTVHIALNKRLIDKSELMMLDMLAHFEWRRPIHFTQIQIVQSLGLLDYLQFDGYAYRLVPIYTPARASSGVGRIDPDYAAPLLLKTFRYGNLADTRVYPDYFTQYNLSASKAREAFARVADVCLERGDTLRAVELLDAGLAQLPVGQIRYTRTNTTPYIRAYYAAGLPEKADPLLSDYAHSLMQYIDYYLRFEGSKADAVTDIIYDKMDQLDALYALSSTYGRTELHDRLADFYRSLGATDEELNL